MGSGELLSVTGSSSFWATEAAHWDSAPCLPEWIREGNFAAYSMRHPTNLRAMMLALWPPKPKELFTMASTFISRAVCGM